MMMSEYMIDDVVEGIIAIPFTQYMLPDGRQKLVTIERPEHIGKMANEIMSEGYEFEAEILTTGQISFTVFDPDEEMDLGCEFSENGPEVTEAVDRLVTHFYQNYIIADNVETYDGQEFI